MADESGSRHNQSMEDRNDELVNENVEHLIEEDEYPDGGEGADEDEDEIESEEEEGEEMMNVDSENGAETASLSGCEEDAYEQGLSGYDVDGLCCPICLDTWTNAGDHQVCCLPCGHIYGLSCIKTWIQRNESSRKCPQCKKSCSLQDIRVLYASRIVAVDEKLQEKVKWLEAKCDSMKKKVKEAMEGRMVEMEAVVARMAAEQTAKWAEVARAHAEQAAKLAQLQEQAERYRMENNARMQAFEMLMASQIRSLPQPSPWPSHTSP